MSDLIDRYVTAVAANLPKGDRADVPAELRDILYSKVEAKEEALGRPLSRAEEEAILQDYGHPLSVAGSYGKHQTLIGPTYYPFYIFTLKVVGGILLALYIAGVVFDLATDVSRVDVASGRPDPDVDFVPLLFMAGGIITLVFALIERYGKPGRRFKWRPSQLPQLGAPHGRSPFEVLFEIAMISLAILWWVGALPIPDPAPLFIDLKLAPVWDTVYWPVLAYFVLQVALDVYELVMPGLARTHTALRLGYNLLALPIVAFIWQAGHWVDVIVTDGRPGLQATLQANFDKGMKVGLAFAFLIIAFEVGRLSLKLIRWGRLQRVKAA